jgi:hypothetical protein
LNIPQGSLVSWPLFHLENFDLVTTIFYQQSKHQGHNYQDFNYVHASLSPLSFESYSTQPTAKSSSLSQNQSYCGSYSLASAIAAAMDCFDSMNYENYADANVDLSGMSHRRKSHYSNASF